MKSMIILINVKTTMGMEAEYILLAALIIIFIASFCGLLQKIRKTYENDRELTARMATNVSSPRISLTEVYVNPAFHTNGENNGDPFGGHVFPSAPPPYTETFCEPPPKYEDIIKNVNTPPVLLHVGTSSASSTPA